jgi:hypothetical protein
MQSTLTETANDPTALAGNLQASVSSSLGADPADFAVVAAVDADSIGVTLLNPTPAPTPPPTEEEVGPAPANGLYVFLILLFVGVVLGGGYVLTKQPVGGAQANTARDVEAGAPISTADVPVFIEEQQSSRPVLLQEQQSGPPQTQDFPLLEQSEMDQVVTTAVQIDEAPKGAMCCSWF